MLVSWEYVYKRRRWSLESVFSGLENKTWEEFENFHKLRGITCPPKSSFDALVKQMEAAQVVSKPAPKPKPVQKKKRTYTRKKGTSNDRGKKGTS